MRKKLLATCITAFLLASGFALSGCYIIEPGTSASSQSSQSSQSGSSSPSESSSKDSSSGDSTSSDSTPPEVEKDELEFELVGDSYKVASVGSATKNTGKVEIPAQYNGLPVTAIGERAFYNEYELGWIISPDSVTEIGKEAFAHCPNLMTVEMGNGVTELGEKGFYNCSMLRNVTFSQKLVNIGNSAFQDCRRLQAVEFPNTLEYIGNNAFDYCEVMPSVTFGTGLKSIGVEAFKNCVKLTEVAIPDGAPTQIGQRAFAIENLNGNVQFRSSLKRIKLGNSVVSIGSEAFVGAAKVYTIEIGDSVTTIGSNAFANCRKLYYVALGSSVTSIASNAFSKSDAIREVYNRSSKLTITAGSSGNGGVAINAYYVRKPGEPTRLSKDENGLVFYTDSTKKVLINGEFDERTNIVVPNDVDEIADKAFYNDTYVCGLDVGTKCKVIGTGAFQNCYTLEKVILREGMTQIKNQAFMNNHALISVHIYSKSMTVGTAAFKKKAGESESKAYGTIYFKGTAAEWETAKAKFGDSNEDFLGTEDKAADVAYYSESQPTGEGKFWHFVDNKATLWK